MHPFKKKSQMTSEEFKTALREAGFGVAQGWIVDVSSQCTGFGTLPSFNKRRPQSQRHAVEGHLGTRRRD
jgi:hypothetical protein